MPQIVFFRGGSIADIPKRITKALRTGKEKELLRFGDRLTITRKLGRGQQGIVVLALNQSKKRFAIKIYAPTDRDAEILSRGRERFIREAKILLELQHRNIVTIYESGSANWNDKTKEWNVFSGSHTLGKILYYVMEFVEGKSVSSLFIKRFDRKSCQYIVDPCKVHEESLGLFEELITQITDAIVFFHSKGIVHTDIKPENIIYSTDDRNFILVDFGFAKHLGKQTAKSWQDVMPRKPLLDYDSYNLGSVDEKADQYSFAKMLDLLLVLFQPMYTSRNYYGLKESLKVSMQSRDHRYKTMVEFRKALEPYLYINPYSNYSFQANTFLVPSRRFGYLDQRIRIPFSSSIPTSDEILEIIDTADFQRLRGVCQLGPTHFVYPGAKHTRFEHSLGAYSLILRYLEVLLKNPAFYKTLTNPEEDIKVVVLGALLHDIGHYPYSHWIEEMKGIRKLKISRHEDRGAEIVLKGRIGKIIESKWKVETSKVCKLMKGVDLGSKEQLLHSMIDSDIDVDRVDYLQRDSAHCGVPYGSAFDVDRLISSLWVNEKKNKICLTEKGRSAFASLLMSNIVMYQEVYWHKTVRACTAMFKRFFYELLERDILDVETADNYLSCSDEQFIGKLFTRARYKRADQRLIDLILPFTNRNRELYKPAFVHYSEHGSHQGDYNTTGFFKQIAEKKDYTYVVELSKLLVDELKRTIPDLEDLDIILESAPVGYRERSKLEGFKFYDEKRREYEKLTTETEDLNRYLESNQRHYIFCRPRHYSNMLELSKNGKLDQALGAVLAKADSL